MNTPTVQATFNAYLPRFTADLEGDLSPVLFVTNLEHDFPAWEAAELVDDVIGETQTLEPVRTPLPPLSMNIEAALAKCRQHPDRFNWKPYALAAGFPEHVVNGEMEYVVHNESGGDLCARNASSGAICWIQQITGEAAYLDPATCMAVGYAKWVDGGRDFWRHWYQWWN